jgi:hypothetical protein
VERGDDLVDEHADVNASLERVAVKDLDVIECVLSSPAYVRVRNELSQQRDDLAKVDVAMLTCDMTDARKRAAADSGPTVVK